ncbi:MAG: MucB/RseB C-terminal domain-containing protein [Gammaproteobacteria bacterium]|nr:MucB/RseB C-terminal domain-containing protein [Gammaproteobacteria bacterium]
MKIKLFSSLALLTFFSTFNVFADEQAAKQWLERMVEAVNTLDYQGTFIYLHGNQLEAMRIVHAVSDGKQRERLTSLNGAPREVIRDQSSVTCVMPESQQISVDKRPLSRKYLAQLPEDLQQLDDHYLFRRLGKGRVAGRHARVVAIIPKDGLRYGYRFFVDEQSGLPLKSDLMNEKGKAVEQTMFTHIEVGVAEIGEIHTDLSDDQKMRIGPETVRTNTAQPLEESAWEFRNLPEGFSLSMRNQLPDPGSEGTIEQYVLSDGLASLSVFVESAGRGEALNGVSRLGSINAWGGELEGYQVTLVGEVPEVTLLSIVNAMQLKQ